MSSTSHASHLASPSALRELFLDTAFSIAARLCRDALWDGRRCTWLGPSSEHVDGDWKVVPRTYGPELYHGTAGNALFLGRLFQAVQDPVLRAVAEGAMRQALSRRHTIAPAMRSGFYTGWSGLAHVCVELGEVLADARWTDEGLRLFRDLRHEDLDDQAIDVLAGYAGGLAALLRAHHRLSPFRVAGELDDLLDLATRFGDKLLDLATERAEGLSWDTMQGSAQDHLTGFSHGTAGIAWALLELGEATGEARFRAAGLEGFRYERSWLDSAEENWPDLRDPDILQMPRNPNADGFTLTYPFLWCHGAPGIGLSRLRGWQITGEDVLRQEAEIALRSTGRDLESQAPSVGNYSLCHGFAGNAELLIYGSQVLGEAAYRRAAEQVGLRGIRRHGGADGVWPSGMRDAHEAPNLMLGTAGTGYFYLRLHDPETVPPILILPRA